MTLFSGIVIFIILWWLVFFMSLPIGVRPPHEMGEAAERGHETGAPVKPRLWMKVLGSTLVAAVLWGIAWWLIAADVISFRPG